MTGVTTNIERNRLGDGQRLIEAVLDLENMRREPLPDGEKLAPVLTDKQVVERALALASCRTARSAMPHAWSLEQMQYVSSRVAQQVERAELYDPVQVMKICDELAADLDDIRGGTPSARLFEKTQQTGWRIVLIPRISFSRGKLAVSHDYRPSTLAAAIAYAVALLLDANRPYRAKLCRCDLSTCRRFFLAPPSMRGKGGKPMTTACSRKHKRRADSEKSIARVRRKRELDKAKRIKK